MGKSEGKGEIRAAQLTPALVSFELDVTMPGPPNTAFPPLSSPDKSGGARTVQILQCPLFI
jgi:hypothetical protein